MKTFGIMGLRGALLSFVLFSICVTESILSDHYRHPSRINIDQILSESFVPTCGALATLLVAVRIGADFCKMMLPGRCYPAIGFGAVSAMFGLAWISRVPSGGWNIVAVTALIAFGIGFLPPPPNEVR